MNTLGTVAILALCGVTAAVADPLPGAPVPSTPAEDHVRPTLIMRGLDKITARAFDIAAPLNVPVRFATLTITARYCYSTPQSETPETAAFVQIDDQRPDQKLKHVFSGWMYASSPGLNGMEHPLYDVWVIFCKTSAPGTKSVVASHAPVKVKSPDATDNEALTPLPEGAGQ